MAQLSPTGDNASSFAAPGDVSRTVLVVPPVARFEAIVEAFTGPLPAPQAGVLRRWLRATSVAVVWRALEPGLRQGGQAARRQLFARLADWQR